MPASQPIWQTSREFSSKNKFEKFAQSYSREYVSLFTNLNKIMMVLSSGQRVGAFRFGFFRSEGADVYRIGQTAVAGAKESRLYVYPDEKLHVMHILSIGTKDHQTSDINEAKDIVREIKKVSAK